MVTKSKLDGTREKTGGRVKGTPNRISASLKEMILAALDKAGGVEYLQRQADESPASFLTLVGKVLPLQVTGQDGGAIQIQQITRRLVDPKQ